MALVVKNPPGNGGDPGSIPGSERSPGGGHGNPHQYSCLRNPMDRGAWWVTVRGVAKIWTRLSNRAHTQAADGSLVAGPVGSNRKRSPFSDFRESV